MKVNRKGICIRVVAALLVAVLFMSLCPVIPSASAAGEYTVTFDLGSVGTPTFCTGFSSTVTVNAGETALTPFAINEAGNKKYYPLEGWVMENGDGTVILPGDQTEQIRGNVKYIAKWRTDTGYNESGMTKVNLYANDGMYDNYQFCYYIPQAKHGETSLFAIPINPFKNSNKYVFSEWKKVVIHNFMLYPNETIEGSAATPGNTVTVKGLCERIDLYASCSEKKYSITYHFNDPAGGEDISAGSYVNYSTNYQVTIKGIVEALHNSSKYNDGDRVKGCVFAGWSTTKSGPADSQYNAGETVTLSDNLDLYAVWEEKSFGYTVKYHFKDSVDGEDVVEEKTDNAILDGPIPYDKDAKTNDGKTYAFDRVEEEKVVTQVADNNVIDVYYYLDTLSDENESQNDSDNIPDIYQKVITYKVNNGTWDGGVLDQINEIVTLRDENGALSLTGTAKLEKVPKGERTDSKYSETGVWNTGNGKKPEKVGSLDNTTFTLTFLEADKAIKIIPSSSPEIPYDGEKHTFNVFEAYDINGDKLDNVVVTVKETATLPEEFYGISAGQTVDIQSWLSANGKTWSDYFTVTVDDDEISLSDKAVIFQTGDLGIVPKPLTVKMEIDAKIFDDGNKGIEYEYDETQKELTVSYRYDALVHTLSLEKCTLDGIVEGDKDYVSLCLPGKTGAPTVGVEHVDDRKQTIDFKNLSLTGDKAGNYTIDVNKINVTANISGARVAAPVEKLSIQITPRPVDYWTFGGAKIYDGSPIRSDREDGTPTDQHNGEPPAHKAKDQVSVWPDYESAYNTLKDGVETCENGFIVRKEETYGVKLRQNEWPGQVREFSPTDANVYLYEMAISNFMDDVTEGREPVQRDDYDIDLHYGYVTIFPQSITDDVDQISADKVLAEGEDLDSFLAELLPTLPEYTYKDSTKADGLIASLKESNTYQDEKDYPAIYTGVKLVNEPKASYTAPYKFEDELLRNENNAEGYKDLKRGTDYTVTYQRQNAAGEWENTTDFTKPGTIQVTYTGIGNYRNRIVRTYELTPAPNPGPDPDPEPDPGPDVEINDHEHYAYMIGKPGGLIDPEGEITRAEIATIIFRLLKEDVREEYWSKTNSFPDVEITDWYNNAISTLENLGIVEGKGDGLYHPEDPITRAEMATMMARLYDYDVNTGDFHTKFDDIDPDAWYARYVAAAEDLGLFVGDGATDHFYPERSLSRAEAMTVYNRLLGRKPHNDGLLPEEQMILWPDNMDTAAWYYADVQEATNSHTCDMDGVVADDKHYELWLEPLPVRDWAALERAWSEAYSGYDGHDVN